MKASEVAILLGYISQTDGRDTTNEYAVAAWHDSLEPWITVADAKAAVINHRRTMPGVYLDVSHINAYARGLRKSRMVANHVVPEIPAGLTQGQERAWTLTFWDGVKSGRTDPQGTADDALRIQRPQLPEADRPRMQALVSATPPGKPSQVGRGRPGRRPPVQSPQTAGETA